MHEPRMRFPALLFFGIVASLVVGLGSCTAAFTQARAQRPARALLASASAARVPAQTPSSPASVPNAAPPTVLLTEGTEVHLVIEENLSSKTSHQGDSVELVLADDIKVGGIVVAKAGASAVGEITFADRKESAWLEDDEGGAELTVRPDYLKVGNYKIHLRGSYGLFKRHKDVKIKKGQLLTVYVARDINLPPA